MSIEADKNILRYTLDQWSYNVRDEDRFCLTSLLSYEPESDEARSKKTELLEILVGRGDGKYECTMGGCEIKSTELGTVAAASGCVAMGYCLSVEWDEVADAPTARAGAEQYQAIIEICEGRFGRGGSGRFCPQIECGFSAGVSEDMVPGSVGECLVQIRTASQSSKD